MSIDKKELRREMKALRRTFSGDLKRRADRMICDSVLTLARARKDRPVLLYCALPDEVSLDEAIRSLLSEGVEVAVPKVLGKTMAFRLIRSFDDLEEGCMQIREPKDSCPVYEAEGSLVLVPGLAFSEDGRRLGYGGGFYDAYFSRHPGNLLAGVCYSFQAGKDVPAEPHDLPVGMVVTEKGVTRCG